MVMMPVVMMVHGIIDGDDASGNMMVHGSIDGSGDDASGNDGAWYY